MRGSSALVTPNLLCTSDANFVMYQNREQTFPFRIKQQGCRPEGIPGSSPDGLLLIVSCDGASVENQTFEREVAFSKPRSDQTSGAY